MSGATLQMLGQIIAEVETTAEINDTSPEVTRREAAGKLKLALGQLRAARTSMIGASRILGVLGE